MLDVLESGFTLWQKDLNYNYRSHINSRSCCIAFIILNSIDFPPSPMGQSPAFVRTASREGCHGILRLPRGHPTAGRVLHIYMSSGTGNVHCLIDG